MHGMWLAGHYYAGCVSLLGSLIAVVGRRNPLRVTADICRHAWAWTSTAVNLVDVTGWVEVRAETHWDPYRQPMGAVVLARLPVLVVVVHFSCDDWRSSYQVCSGSCTQPEGSACGHFSCAGGDPGTLTEEHNTPVLKLFKPPTGIAPTVQVWLDSHYKVAYSRGSGIPTARRTSAIT
ncbi:hypothetical protein OG21DRAFT_156601 [Imleria badia]|nr:hypothetical protein OG21DRAFT_156601 [Imleria badia]